MAKKATTKPKPTEVDEFEFEIEDTSNSAEEISEALVEAEEIMTVDDFDDVVSMPPPAQPTGNVNYGFCCIRGWH